MAPPCPEDAILSSVSWSENRQAGQEYTTGPRTPEGKARSSRNAYKGGQWKKDRELLMELRRLLREQQEILDEF